MVRDWTKKGEMVKPLSDYSAPSKAKVLLISDEPVAAKVWGFSLNQMGLDVTLLDVSSNVMDIWEEERPDLIILEDFNKQPEEIEICKQMRAVSVVPILFLTVRLDETFQLEVYRSGADECITFPITPRLFQAKVLAWLRRTLTIPMNAFDAVRAGDFKLDSNHKTLTMPSGETIRLTSLESRLLFLLMNHAGRLLETAEITDKVWGYCGEGDSSLLKNLVYRLRKKIEPNPNQPRYLITEGNTGYRFIP